MFRVAITPSGLEDIAWFRKRDRNMILDSTEQQLTNEPNVDTRNRKRLRPNDVAEWELRIGDFRVFYDVDEEGNLAEVKMVGRKKGNKLFVRGKEFKL